MILRSLVPDGGRRRSRRPVSVAHLLSFSPVRRIFCATLGLGLFLLSGVTFAGTVTLKFLAINKSQTEKQKVDIKRYLPKFAEPKDVVNAGDLEVVYDVASQAYCVRKQVELEPGQTRTFEVVLNDIWVVPDATLTELGTHARRLADGLKGTEQGDTAGRVSAMVEEDLKSITDRQKMYSIGVAKAVDHIRAFEANVQAIEQVRKDLGVLENLAIAAGKDPEKILGLPKVPPPVETEPGAGTGAVFTIRIQITNPSLTEKKSPPLRHEFPVEIKPTDVRDAGGLQVGFDAGKKVTYAYAEAVELAPQESKTFEVKVRNPWGDLPARLAKVQARAAEVLEATTAGDSYKSVDDEAKSVVDALAGLSREKAPGVLNEEYVAYARRQTERLRTIEARVMRLEELFQPKAKPTILEKTTMPPLKPPSRKTTWIIIYIILGFLAVVSLLFFFRWYGKTRAEQVTKDLPAEAGRRAGREAAGPPRTPPPGGSGPP